MKVEGWQENLFMTVERGDCKFSLGLCDCFIFASEAIRVQTGINLAMPYLEQYKSEKHALKLIKKEGFSHFFDILDTKFSQVHPLMSQRGDIVAFKHPGVFEYALAVCVGEYAIALDPEEGTYPVEMSDWVKSWRIEIPKEDLK